MCDTVKVANFLQMPARYLEQFLHTHSVIRPYTYINASFCSIAILVVCFVEEELIYGLLVNATAY